MGRPRKGLTGAQKTGQITDRLRVAVVRSLDILDREKQPLHKLLAESWKADPIKTLIAVQKLLPREFDIHQTVSVATLHLDAVRELSKPQALPAPTEQPMPITIDVEPEKVGVNGGELTTDKL